MSTNIHQEMLPGVDDSEEESELICIFSASSVTVKLAAPKSTFISFFEHANNDTYLYVSTMSIIRLFAFDVSDPFLTSISSFFILTYSNHE